MNHSRFIEPLDVLILRGNRLFGEPGSYGEALIPPWPSVAAGALRSRMLADSAIDLNAFARGEVEHPELGTPSQPGSFTLTAFQLARRKADGYHEPLFAPPADLTIEEDGEGQPSGQLASATELSAALASSMPLPLHPVLAQRKRGKPTGGYWLTQAGFEAYLNGQPPSPEDLVKSSDLWRIDERIGVGLSSEQRRADDGKLFSTRAIAFSKDVGFVVHISGATPPKNGLLRLGGDGRGAALHASDSRLPVADFTALSQERRCRLVLTTPGLFTHGWLPNGVTREGDGYRFDLHGVRGKLVCAAVPRAEVVSGWDLARWSPKSAQRVAPIGSVWWLDDLDATPQALEKLASEGLWGSPCEDSHRRAEGFNRITLAHWR